MWVGGAYLKVIVQQRQVSSRYDTTLMTDNVAMDTSTVRDRKKAAADFLGSSHCISRRATLKHINNSAP